MNIKKAVLRLLGIFGRVIVDMFNVTYEMHRQIHEGDKK